LVQKVERLSAEVKARDAEIARLRFLAERYAEISADRIDVDSAWHQIWRDFE
jgi:hypothetical protein